MRRARTEANRSSPSAEAGHRQTQTIRKSKSSRAPVESKRSGRTARNRTSLDSPLPEFIPFATCLLVDRPPNGPDWVHEIKLDGWRLQVRVEDGKATLRTRNGHDYSSTFPELARVARGVRQLYIDGEVCAVRKNGITDFSALQAAMKAGKTASLIFFAFDLLFLGDQNLRSLPLMERKKRLQGLLAENEDQKMVQFAEHWVLPAATF
jgi:bifunctional non-homologous end joining protein LigD